MAFHFAEQSLVRRHTGKSQELGEGHVDGVVPRELVDPRHRIRFPQHVVRMTFDLYIQVIQSLEYFG